MLVLLPKDVNIVTHIIPFARKCYSTFKMLFLLLNFQVLSLCLEPVGNSSTQANLMERVYTLAGSLFDKSNDDFHQEVD